MYNTIISVLDACSPFGYPLLACSIALLAVILYHGLFVRPVRLHRLCAAARGNTVLRLASAHPDEPLSQLVLLIKREQDNPEAEAIVESKLRSVIDDLRGGLALISIITNIAPMLGILGTAWGLTDIFGVFGTPEAQSGIAPGIAKALYTTIFGLAIALPGVIAGTCYERRLEHRAALLNEFFTDLLARRRNL